MLRLTGGRFTFVKPTPLQIPDEITQVKVVSSEPDKLFKKKAIPEFHETIQEVDIPFLVTELNSK